MIGPFDGVIVLDLSWILSGPYCTMLLADLGARVIKVERPGVGDSSRGTGPFVGGDSVYFMGLNRNKESITLDIKKDEGKEILLRLVERADVLVENFTPGTLDRLGLGYEELKVRNPRLIYCAISGFGGTGPYAYRPALDVVVQAMGGIMSITGMPDGSPVRVGASIGDITAGLFASVGVASALYERDRSGQGQMLDLSMLDCQVAILENALGRYLATGEVPGPLGTRHPVATPFQAFPTKDGWIVIAIFGGNPTQWALLCAAIGHTELIDEPDLQTAWGRTKRVDYLEPLISDAMRTKTTREWLDELIPMGIPCGPVNRVDEVACDPQITAREMIVELPHRGSGSWKYTNSPFKFTRTPGTVRSSPPDLGEHTEEVLCELLGMSPSQVAGLQGDGVV